MIDPALSEGGFTYERKVLRKHYHKNGFVEPITRKVCKGAILQNFALKIAI
jgi:hypothetical protein